MADGCCPLFLSSKSKIPAAHDFLYIPNILRHIAALCCRLSRDDNIDSISSSIQNPMKIFQKTAKDIFANEYENDFIKALRLELKKLEDKGMDADTFPPASVPESGAKPLGQ